MPTFTRSSTTIADGNSGIQSDTATGTESAKVNLALEQGIAGTLTTRTDNDTGVVTVAAHNIVDTDFVSVFWIDPTTGAEMCHMNMDVTGHTTTTISIDVGLGDNLPVATTPVVISKVASRVVAWDGTAAGMLAFFATLGNRRGSITAQAVGTLIGLVGTDLFRQLKTVSPGYTWMLSPDGAFAFTGNILMLTAALGDVNGAGVATFVRLDT